MLVELAIGDAYGAGFEFADADVVRTRNDLSAYVQHPHHAIRSGCYTDDTQMSIAIAEVIVADSPWTPVSLAEQFVTAFKRDPRLGYARRFRELLCEVSNGHELLARIHPESDRSGAAMRACPIGVFHSVEEVIRRCRVQAVLTHDAAVGSNAAVAAALMTHFLLYQLGPKSELPIFLSQHVPYSWATPWQGEVGASGMMCVHAAVTMVMKNNSLRDLLHECVALTGDVDTVAAIALGAASCSKEITQNLPDHLARDLENGPFGRDYFSQLDQQLMLKVRAAPRVG